MTVLWAITDSNLSQGANSTDHEMWLDLGYILELECQIPAKILVSAWAKGVADQAIYEGRQDQRKTSSQFHSGECTNIGKILQKITVLIKLTNKNILSLPFAFAFPAWSEPWS